VTDGQYTDAAGVVAWTSLGVLFQGVYLMTSIGLNITKQTKYYPVATAIAAAANIGLNFLLIPHYGIMGAAYANGIAYALQAAIAFFFSQRAYPVEYETGRLVKVGLAAVVAYAVARTLPAMAPMAGILARGTAVVAVMTAGLWLGGFLRADELAVLQRVRRARTASAPPPAETTEFAGEIVATDIPEPSDATLAERVEQSKREPVR